MTGLEKAIVDAQNAYYNGIPIMSDTEFDALWDKLKKEQPDSELLQKVGEDHADGFKKVPHKIIMGSQEKANTAEEMDRWLKATLYLAQFKMDGCLSYDTILDTDKGKIPIGKIVEEKIKCKVKTFDFETGDITYTPIKNWFINDNNYKWFELKTDSGETLKVTENHKVWLPKLNCWRTVKDLKEGDEFLIAPQNS